MKILHVLYSGLGGHANVFFSMIDADTNHEFNYDALFNGIEEVRKEYLQKCAEYKFEHFYVAKKPGIDLNYYKNIYRIIKNSNAEIIFLHSSSYIFPAKLAALFSRQKKKIIVRETHANHLKTFMNKVWLCVALLVADQIVFLSEEYKTEVVKHFALFCNRKKLNVIPNGIDLSLFKPSTKIASHQIIIGMQSRIVKIKDHLTLLKAFALLKKEEASNDIIFKLKIAGDGDYVNKLKNFAIELQISNDVEFTGILPQKDISVFLQNLDIYVHASFGETMSTAIMQGMATGLPIVASDVPGINNMIENEYSGLLVPVENANALAKAIKRISTNTILAETLAANALKTATGRYSNQTMFQRYKILFNS